MPKPRFTRPPGVWVDPPASRYASASRLRPSFLIVGAQRSGTTFLYRCLAVHPQVLPALRKEVHYFDFQYAKGQAWYLAHFPAWSGWTQRQGVVTGEASPNYLAHPLAAERAQRFDPKLRIIAVLRDPVARAFSHYRRNRRGGLEPFGFEEALAAEPERMARDAHLLRQPPHYYSRGHHVYSYAERGRYAAQLAPWLQAFGAGRVLVVDAAMLFTAAASTLAAVLAFLGLPPHRLRLPKPANAQPSATLPAAVRHRVAARFALDQQRLAEMLRQTGVACVGTPARTARGAATRPAPTAAAGSVALCCGEEAPQDRWYIVRTQVVRRDEPACSGS